MKAKLIGAAILATLALGACDGSYPNEPANQENAAAKNEAAKVAEPANDAALNAAAVSGKPDNASITNAADDGENGTAIDPKNELAADGSTTSPEKDSRVDGEDPANAAQADGDSSNDWIKFACLIVGLAIGMLVTLFVEWVSRLGKRREGNLSESRHRELVATLEQILERLPADREPESAPPLTQSADTPVLQRPLRREERLQAESEAETGRLAAAETEGETAYFAPPPPPPPPEPTKPAGVDSHAIEKVTARFNAVAGVSAPDPGEYSAQLMDCGQLFDVQISGDGKIEVLDSFSNGAPEVHIVAISLAANAVALVPSFYYLKNFNSVFAQELDAGRPIRDAFRLVVDNAGSLKCVRPAVVVFDAERQPTLHRGELSGFGAPAM